ncbi:hypothetical protein [Streptomyces sp. NRRL F-2799]|uniref:hypothetical protein n=1 Tax=Streptomyces sp. NRRL F-2799 TaxID=1463844 RepID=UPI000AC2F44E|nr:hypothetical protein [Streptomyces sp. NRRL F-2799]
MALCSQRSHDWLPGVRATLTHRIDVCTPHHYPWEYVQLYACNGSAAQKWTLPAA